MKKVIIGIVVIVLGLLGFCIAKRMSLITLQEAAETQRAQIESAYQRRFDLIPQLLAAVQDAAAHERETLAEVTAARNQLQELARVSRSGLPENDASALERHADRMSSAIKSLIRVSVEAYPSLKANENFLSLQHQIEGTENRIHVARVRFNEGVGEYNAEIRRWGDLPFCGGHTPLRRFESVAGANRVPMTDPPK